MSKFFFKFAKNSSMSLMSLIFTGLIIFGGIYFYMVIRLPEVTQLKEMGMQLPLRVYSIDGKLIGEFGEKKRIPVTINQVPKQLMNAILDTEDQRFYEHRGVDFLGLMRAAMAFAESGKKSQGASTITMQVARNFFLNREKTFARKLNEILLAFKIDSTFSKEEVFELYLNKIYLGNRAYGVASAAQVYYGKPLSELNLAQMAMIAGLPQAPSRDNPIVNPEAARDRRNHVLQRMYERGHISSAAYKEAIAAPDNASYHELQSEVAAPYVAEMARNAVVSQFGDEVYDAGIKIYTTIDSHLQGIANQSLHDGILAYDERHGYRGTEGHLATDNRTYWRRKLQNISIINDLLPAAVVDTSNKTISAMLSNGTNINISASNFAWAHPQLSRGDIIRVYKTASGQWRFAQLPKIEGSIITLDPKNGAILALSGGFSYADSNFNRAIQADRQTGSAFKPFIYSAALDKEFTLASVINDAPIVLTDPSTRSLWRPQNDTQVFYGPTRLRTALTQSRNLVSIRLLQAIGIPYAVDYLKKFGFEGSAEVPPSPSLALGTGAVTPLKMTAAYATFANGGYKITPFFISSIVDANNKKIFEAKPVAVPDAPHAITEQNAYLITNALKDVIETGTARKAKALQRKDLAGKTGTTNDQRDAWFIGFNSDFVTSVWMGFDQPQSIYEHGAQAALPVWMQFMQSALTGKPEHGLAQPSNISTVRIDPTSGLLAAPGQKNAIFESFISSTVPTDVVDLTQQALDNPTTQEDTDGAPTTDALF